MMTIRQILMSRDHLTADEADERISQARDDLRGRIATGDLLGAEDVCLDHFGLEADYLDELLLGIDHLDETLLGLGEPVDDRQLDLF